MAASLLSVPTPMVPAPSCERSPVHVMHVMYALQPGGMEFGVLKLVNGHDRTRVRSSILSTRPASELKELLAADVPLYELSRRPGADLRTVWQMYRVFRNTKPDVVHTHAWGTLIEGIAAARLAGVPIVVHGEHGTLQLRGYQRFVQRRAWSAVDRVLAVSTKLAERMAAETGFPLPRIETIRNGVDLTRFGHASRSAARAALNLSPDNMVIGTMGRLVPVKNQVSLIEAARQLRTLGLEPTVVIAGEGYLRNRLEEHAAAAGVGDAVRFLGQRTDPEMVLAAMDVYALTSVSEGLPNTVLEAMATGLPVVSTRVGGVEELVEHGVTGFVVPPNDPDALAKTLALLLRDESLRRTAGAAGRLRAESEFAISGMIRRYESLYVSAARPGDPKDGHVVWPQRANTSGM
jgi:sugar transferase (PEP-CTERM/EpsH1 system associated)